MMFHRFANWRKNLACSRAVDLMQWIFNGGVRAGAHPSFGSRKQSRHAGKKEQDYSVFRK